VPLKRGGSQQIISQNIRKLIKEGKSRSQAAAIAFKEAGKRGKRKRKWPRAKEALPCCYC